jgi:magnesium transporter
MNINEQILEILDYLSDNKDEKVRDILGVMHNADIADLLIHINKAEDRRRLFNLVDIEHRGGVLIGLETPIIEQLLENLNVEEKSEIINQLDSDDATDILAVIDEEEHEQVLEHVDEEQKEEVLELLAYSDDSAGGLMSKEFVTITEKMPAKDIISEIRRAKDEVEELYNVWVTDERNHLLGRVRMKDLILASPTTIASEIMTDSYHWVNIHDEQEDVARIFEKYDLVEVPVVNEKHQIVGHITIDDIVDVIEDEAHDDFSKLAGTGAEIIKEFSVFRIVRARIPWLIVALFAGIGAASIMSVYDEVLENYFKLAFFIPVVIGMGGNVGIQSSSIVIRGLATGEINMYDIRHRLFKELLVSIMNGVLVSLFLMTLITLFFNDFKLALICSLSMIIAMLLAGVVGAIVPFILKRLNLDPALSSGPFVTTSNDIFGTLIYFLIAQQLM